MAYLTPTPKMQFFDNNGVPLASGKLYTYAAGTTTPKDTFTNYGGGTANANPVILNSRGEANVWLGTGRYYWELKDSTDALIWTADDIGYSYLTTNDLYNQGTEADIASASSVDIGAQNTCFLQITGTTTITSFGTNYKGPRYIRFAGALTLTHNATSLILPTGANITTAAGDSMIVIPKATTGPADGWKIVAYQRADGSALVVINLSGGVAGAIPYQSAVGETAFSAAGTSGQVLKSGGTGAPTWGSLSQIQPISASVASSALTISASALTLDFRSTTLGSGTVSAVTGTPANLVISSGSTLGTTNAIQSDIVVLAINNAGTIELAAVNMSGGTDLSETGLISTTAEGGGGGADSATVVYSTTARSNLAYRVIGVIRSTQATAGTWATAPSLIQGVGGQPFAALQSLGYGQTWQDVSASRVLGTTYYNATGRPIAVNVQGSASAASVCLGLTVNGVSIVGTGAGGASGPANVFAIVPPGASYFTTLPNGGTVTLSTWVELR